MGCDCYNVSDTAKEGALSVSSNGSNGLRPEEDSKSFASRVLSVSSNGSNGLRLRRCTGVSTVPAAFSILERIEWAATRPGA